LYFITELCSFEGFTLHICCEAYRRIHDIRPATVLKN